MAVHPQHPNPLKLLIIWGRWLPYHHARYRGLKVAAEKRGHRVIGVEYSAGSRDYAWMQRGDTSDVISLPNRKSESEFCLRTIFGKLLPLLERERPDVVFVPSYWPWSLATTLISKSLGARVVMMNESHGGTVSPGWKKALFRRATMTLFDAGLVGGKLHRNYFSSIGLPEQKIVTGYDAVDVDFWEEAAKSQTGEPTDLPESFILWAGRIEAKKNVPVLLSAWALLKQQLGSACPALLLVGDGSKKAELLSQAEQLQIPLVDRTVPGPHIQLRPFVTAEQLATLYARAEAFVLCSRFEEWGLVVNEAMACGAPVVVSRTAGCYTDLVESVGIGFDPEDPAELAKALERFHAEPKLRAGMSRRGREKAREFSADAFGKQALKAAALAVEA